MDETPLRQRIEARQSASNQAESTAPAGQWEDVPPNEPQPQQNNASVRSVVRELLETAIFVLLVFLIVRGVVQNFKIEGGSMEPNLHSGQYILVNKITYFHLDLNAPLRLLPGNADLPEDMLYPFGAPKRGDVVVFEYPRDIKTDYIKRVIGLPGDSVRVAEGRVYVNGTLLDEPYIDEQTVCRPDDPCANGNTIVVPQNAIFVLGDNRPNSSDSREWGELAYNHVIGKAWVSYWPPEQWSVVAVPSYATAPAP